jgi:hypothetical protein
MQPHGKKAHLYDEGKAYIGTALASWDAAAGARDGELHFSKGEVISDVVKNVPRGGGSTGSLGDARGAFPSCFVSLSEVARSSKWWRAKETARQQGAGDGGPGSSRGGAALRRAARRSSAKHKMAHSRAQVVARLGALGAAKSEAARMMKMLTAQPVDDAASGAQLAVQEKLQGSNGAKGPVAGDDSAWQREEHESEDEGMVLLLIGGTAVRLLHRGTLSSVVDDHLLGTLKERMQQAELMRRDAAKLMQRGRGAEQARERQERPRLQARWSAQWQLQLQDDVARFRWHADYAEAVRLLGLSLALTPSNGGAGRSGSSQRRKLRAELRQCAASY